LDKQETTMTTMTRRSALALAAAAFATTTFLAGNAPAGTTLAEKQPIPTQAISGSTVTPPAAGRLIGRLPSGELGQVTGATGGQASGPGRLIGRLPPGELGQLTGALGGQAAGPGRIIGKLPPGVLCRFESFCGGTKLPPGNPPKPPKPPAPPYWGGDRDHDHDHDDYGGWYFRHYGWRYAPPIVVEGVPAPVVTAPVVEGGPAPVVQRAPVRAPMAAAQPVVGPQAEAAPCNCLTKQKLADGSVLFQDICTKETAIAPPQALGER
jgi:hypothetical protein